MADVDPALREQILDNLADGVYFVDPDRRITYWNRGAERLSGYGASHMVGRLCFDNILSHVDATGAELCHGSCPLAGTIADGTEREAQVWLRHRDGSRRPVRVRTSPLRDAAGAIVGGIEVFDDATVLVAARQQAEAARRDALLDDLTGIPNRRFFNMMLGARVEDLERYETPFALIVADIDHFKRVNDIHGHAVGDELLQAVARTLLGGVREGDFVARWGGEEFAVIAQHAAAEEAQQVAERLRALVAAARVDVAGEPLTATISLGVALAASGKSGPDLLGRADRALYLAKSAGRNRVAFDH